MVRLLATGGSVSEEKTLGGEERRGDRGSRTRGPHGVDWRTARKPLLTYQ